eukprot:CAMPEP_0181205642 /NCGR_PEP_ID=MMETSP1096-20121128/20590_1 /TAXON_ID=156174 ORGANISM="Chrysochromulina ericina, Strain CCMP281" /NCGR_SAMPLE_ID=MMETSP1096 /ASSEMBLY_ACC=CAM_ASM_000453 /LENGTH=73 /DNA_ID=CAMNT_0023296447 /DNA_START=347 /DNA_END=568 /DNA_ORIENTATION=-
MTTSNDGAPNSLHVTPVHPVVAAVDCGDSGDPERRDALWAQRLSRVCQLADTTRAQQPTDPSTRVGSNCRVSG